MSLKDGRKSKIVKAAMPKPKKRKEPELTEKQAAWVELVLQGVSYVEAYRQVYDPDTNSTEGSIRAAASRIRTKPAVSKALGQAKVEINTKQILWTKEMAITKLMKLLVKAEEELGRGPLSKTISETILGSIKELNLIAGHNWKDQEQTKIQLAKLEIERLNYELNKKTKLSDPAEIEDMEDDGFMDAIKGQIANIWEEE